MALLVFKYSMMNGKRSKYFDLQRFLSITNQAHSLIRSHAFI